MKFTQLLVVLALCSVAIAQTATTTALAVAPSDGKLVVNYQSAPQYTVVVTANSGSTAPVGNVTITISSVERGNCTLNAVGTTATSSCTIVDTKPSGSNLLLGTNSAIAAFVPASGFSASSVTTNFTVYALPVVLLTYNGLADDVNVPLPSADVTLISTIDITNSGTGTPPSGTVNLSQTSTNPSFTANLTCTVVTTTSPYICTLIIPQAYLVGGQNYTLLASFIPGTGSQFGPDGSKSITLRVQTTNTTTTTTTTTTAASTTTTTAGVSTITGATTGGAPFGYTNVVVNTVFAGTCALNFTSTTQGLFTSFLATVNGAGTNVTLTQVGSCVDNGNGTFYIQINATGAIPSDFLGLFSTFQAGLASIGLTSTGVVVVSAVPRPAPSSTTGTTGASTGTSTTAASGTTATGASTQTTASVATTQSTVTATVTGPTSGASSVVVGATALLIFAALL